MGIMKKIGYCLLISVAGVIFFSGARAFPLNLVLIGQATNEANDISIIRKVVAANATKYTPEWKYYTIDNICIAGAFATADIYDQNTGGERVLKKEAGNWKIISSTGGGYDENNLIHIGIPSDTAKKLLQKQNCINHEK
ncbi:MAG: hypothetical protein KME30_31335 [Iphinoe sp. HA4291-MV1]|jgi:hypothetical protein|nr:hypothetical protein [Iphinoe sp. HA4291-MV1]